ncbi:methylated-DNA--[protein]-cysteine S-methyltransferase [Virgibacillus pantothenticus]|uniref:methylated-DNA--[protein]-cysteine S-methyltransferase n=1 Tax=Virgibacillus pantothenticus TaxID=1473 RepID=UPI001E4FDD92
MAERLGKPKSYRAVASAIAKNPLLIIIPYQRVVNKNGKNTGYRGGIDFKLKLIQFERDLTQQ